MQSRMVAVSLGIALVACVPSLISPLIPLSISLSLVCLARHKSARHLDAAMYGLACLFLGLSYGFWHGQSSIAQRWPQHYEDQALQVLGTIKGLPSKQFRYGQTVQRFIFHIDTGPIDLPSKQILLNWYGGPQLVAGQRWLLTVKGRQPRGLSNPAGFDYQAWMLQRGIDGQARVVNAESSRLISIDKSNLDYWRWQWAEFLQQRLSSTANAGLIRALLMSDTRAISSQQWQQLTTSGTVHLFVISGLHIGLLALLGFYVGRGLAILLCAHRVLDVSCVTAILFAAFYSAAAGFSLPTQRALVMVIVFMLGMVWARHSGLFYRYSLALLICLLINPLAVISSSFWLSFTAVGVILLACSKQQYALVYQRFYRQPWFRAQLAVFIGLLPILLILFNQAPLLSVLINLIAIPLFTFLLVPLLFISCIFSLLDRGFISVYLWAACDHLLSLFIALLGIFEHSLIVLRTESLSWYGWLFLLLACLLLLLPSLLPARVLAMVFLLPIIAVKNKPISEQAFSILVFDVGQGLSVLITVNDRHLLYDVGANWGEGSMAKTVIIPYLKAKGIKSLDALVISHNDNDHAGGIDDIFHLLSVEQLFTGEHLPHYSTRAEHCHQQHWRWQAVDFQFISVGQAMQGNNASCILKVSNASHSLLLTGDIEREVEKLLISDGSRDLAADILLAPHHGSLSSSSWPLIKRVNPKVVVYSTAYKNRFNHPNDIVMQRYQDINTKQFNTANHGAVIISADDNPQLRIDHHRANKAYYWQ